MEFGFYWRLTATAGGKEGRWYLYSAFKYGRILTKRPDMDHTVMFYLQTTPCLPFLRKRSPDGAIATETADIQLQLTTHLSTPKNDERLS